MADFTALKTAIQTYIKQNGNEEITGEKLQEILLSMVTTLGDSAINDLITALNDEVAARQNADGTLQQNITNEATARGNADTALQGLINGVKNNVDNGYVYAGIATPSTTPATGKVFYLALTAGTYTNFGSTEVYQGINILKYNGSAWSLDAFIGIDDTPTPNSPKLVKSGGVFDKVMTDGSAFDISAYFASGGTLATYADLSAALTALNSLSADYKRGGMSIKFVQSSDNKYVQYRLMKDTWSVTEDDWQGIDDEPTAGSENLVKSGGVFKKIASEVTTISNRGTYVAQYFNNFFADNYLFQGNGIVYTASTTAAWQGISIKINNPIIGKKICVDITRSGSYNNKPWRSSWFDAAGVEHDKVAHNSGDTFVVPEGAVSVLIILVVVWDGEAYSAGAQCTFDNVNVYYVTEIVNNLISNKTTAALSAAMGNELKNLIDRVAIMVPASDIIFDISTWKITLPAYTFIKHDSLKYVYQLLEDTVIDAVNNAATSIVLFDRNAKTFSCVPWDTNITALDEKYVVCNCITQIQGNIVDCLYGQAYTVNGGSLLTTYTKINEKINSINYTAFSINYNAGTVTHTLFELKQRDNYLFQGDNIVYTAAINNIWQGLIFTIDKPIIGKVLHVNADRTGGYGNNYIRFSWYDAENVAHVGPFYSGNSVNYTIPDGAIKIIVLLSVAWDGTGGETAGQVYQAGSQCTFNNVDIYYIESVVSEESYKELVSGSGEYPYYGVRKLDIAFNTFKMDMNILMTRKYSDSPEAEPHTYRSIQSIAIYDGIIFGFLQGQGCYLFNLDTKEDIGYMDVPFYSHSNSAQFTDVFYNENDRFPLLLLSRCDYSTGKTSVLRITESNGVYSCTLIKDIVIDTYAFKNYGGSACADLNRRKLIVTHTLNGDWRVTTNNPAVLEEFDLPDLTSPEETVYTAADGKTLAYNPFYIIQGMTYDNGYIYQAAQLRNNNFLDRYGVGNIGCIIVFDAASGEIRNIIPSNSYEPEGVAVFNNKLYLQAANQEGSGDDIVFWLHEYQF